MDVIISVIGVIGIFILIGYSLHRLVNYITKDIWRQ